MARGGFEWCTLVRVRVWWSMRSRERKAGQDRDACEEGGRKICTCLALDVRAEGRVRGRMRRAVCQILYGDVSRPRPAPASAHPCPDRDRPIVAAAAHGPRPRPTATLYGRGPPTSHIAPSPCMQTMCTSSSSVLLPRASLRSHAVHTRPVLHVDLALRSASAL